MKRRDYKRQILRENYGYYISNGSNMSFREYVELEAESDPTFFQWLLEDGEIADFGTNMTDEQKKDYEDFIESLA